MDELGSEDLSTFEDNNITQHGMINNINSQSSNNRINQISINISNVQNNSREIISSYLGSKMFHTNSQQDSNLTHQLLR